MTKYILLVIIVLSLFSCAEDSFKTYTSGHYLFFTTDKGVDSTEFSFTHFPLEEEHVVYFEVNMIGDMLSEAAPYAIYVIDSLTTAKASQYKLVTPYFAANQTKDTLAVTLVKTEDLEDNVTLVLALGSNDIFQPGIVTQRRVKIMFNNTFSKPLWWKGKIQTLYLGTFSKKKFKEFVLCTGISDLSEMDLSEVRMLALQFKEYIAKNNIMDVDDATGKEFPMTVPVN